MKADVTLSLNPNEIRDIKYVTPQELQEMFRDPSKFNNYKLSFINFV